MNRKYCLTLICWRWYGSIYVGSLVWNLFAQPSIGHKWLSVFAVDFVICKCFLFEKDMCLMVISTQLELEDGVLWKICAGFSGGVYGRAKIEMKGPS